MAFVLAHFDVGEYDRWKQMFDSDPAGREQAGVGQGRSKKAAEQAAAQEVLAKLGIS